MNRKVFSINIISSVNSQSFLLSCKNIRHDSNIFFFISFFFLNNISLINDRNGLVGYSRFVHLILFIFLISDSTYLDNIISF